MKQTNWIVVTGGPSSGKSTLLEYFKSQGHFIVPESARILIDQEIAKGKTLQEIRADEGAFQNKVLEMKLKWEEKTSPEQFTFFDRGIPDSIAYTQVCGVDTTLAFVASQKRRYKKVFHLEQVPFENDYSRIEDQEKAHVVSELLFDVYTSLGYKVVRVPLMSIEERAILIFRSIEARE
jgi:predicted ATPase